MNREELIRSIAEEVLKEVITKQKDDDVVKTSETPKALTPLERAKAMQRRTASKYDGYISAKLLPSLSK